MRARARGVVARRGRLDDVELGERAQQRRRVGGRGDDVEVLDRVGQRGGPSRPARRARRPGGRAARLTIAVADRQRPLQQRARARGPSATPGGEGRRGRPPRTSARTHARRAGARPRRPPAAPSSESMPSSSNSWRARLGPRPGRRVMLDEPGRELRAQLLGGGIGRCRAAPDLLLQRAPDARQLGDRPLAGQRGHRARRLAHRLGRVAVGEHAVDDRAVELVEVGELVEERGDRGVGGSGGHRCEVGSLVIPLGYAALMPGLALAHPPDLDEAENLEAIVGAALAALARAAPSGFRILVVDDGSPDGTGRHRRRSRRRARGGPGAAPRAARGARPRLPGRLRAARSTRASDTSSRWTPTSPTTRPTSPGCSARCATAPTSRSARATSPAAA